MGVLDKQTGEMIMKVSNFTSNAGNKVPNQFVVQDGAIEYFQSYESVIVMIDRTGGGISVSLDENYWDYSVTTSKYRNQFLGENKKETQAKIDSGEYKLTNLN